VEFQLLTFGQTFKSGAFDRADVDEHIFAAFIALDEAEALASVEEFYDALALADDLRGHAATAAATAASATKAAATAAAKTAAASTASEAAATRAAAPETVIAAALLPTEERIEFVFSEPIALVASPTTATTSVKTHLCKQTFESPHETGSAAWTIRTRPREEPRLRQSKRILTSIHLYDFPQDCEHIRECLPGGAAGRIRPASR
jgi:hypothetical protein